MSTDVYVFLVYFIIFSGLSGVIFNMIYKISKLAKDKNLLFMGIFLSILVFLVPFLMEDDKGNLFIRLVSGN